MGCPLFTTRISIWKKNNENYNWIIHYFQIYEYTLPDVCVAIILFCNSLIGADAVLLEWSITLGPIFMPNNKKKKVEELKQ